MTAAALPLHRTANPFKAIIVLIFIGVLLATAVQASWHAIQRHGPDALTAQNCFNRGGTIMQEAYQDPLTGRTMKICQQQGKWYVSIDGADGGNITMFPRTFARCLRDVIEYAKRSGFIRAIMLH